jgi:hypothetical protein
MKKGDIGRACSTNYVEEGGRAFRVLVGELGRKRPLGRPRHRREGFI